MSDRSDPERTIGYTPFRMPEAADIAVSEALWNKVEEAFEQDEPHAVYLAHCHKTDQLPEAARRYRALKEGLPQDDPKRAKIDKRLAAVAFMAMASLDEKRTAAPNPRARTLFTVLAALIMAAAMIGLIRALML